MLYPPRPMHAARLAASNLACLRGERLLFSGLSFTLEAGQALQIAGSNGVGKSSLIRICAGLLRPFTGTVENSGEIGLVDERPALDPHLPLGKALAFWARIDGHDAGEHFGPLGLESLLDVPVRYLSTGQKKRAALARLLGQRAQVWLLDEPLNGLDTAAVALVERLVAEHCGRGGVALVASHQAIALPGANRIELANYLPSRLREGSGVGQSDAAPIPDTPTPSPSRKREGNA
jgi:heme exporter protein A